MSVLTPLLTPDHVRCQSPATSRKRVLQDAAAALTDNDNAADQLFDELMARERLGSTALGEGVAIPHCRGACDAMRVYMITTSVPVDYEAADGDGVDIFFVLVVPKEEKELHLHALAELSTAFAEAAHRQALRACHSDQELHDVMHGLLGGAPPSAAQR